MGQKVEASNLRVSANNQGYYIRGDVKINGIPAALDYRKPRGDADAEVRMQATLDDAGRGKLGFDVGSYLSGPVPVKINGRVPPHGRRKPLCGRSRPDPGAHRPVAARLDQAGRPVVARDLHARQQGSNRSGSTTS